MNARIVWRIAWKEYRMIRGFWLGMAALAVFGQVLVLSVMAFTDPTEEAAPVMFGFALGASAFYALGCGATLFATEHEVGTYPFLRSLPVSPESALAGKVVSALLSVSAIFAALWLVSLFLSRFELPDRRTHSLLWALWGLAALEFLAWGILFSLLLKRPLIAAILAVAVAATVVHAFLIQEQLVGLSMDPYSDAFVSRILVVLAVSAIDFWLALRWFHSPRAESGGLLRRDKTLEDAAPVVESHETRSGRIALGRLVWHAWRQSWRTWAVMAFASLLISLSLAIMSGTRLNRLIHPETILHTTPLLLALFSALVGSTLFLSDHQQRSFRFFADHGVSPRRVWLSRQLVGLTVVGVATMLAAIITLLCGSGMPHERADYWIFGPGFFLLPYLALFGFVASQYCSLFLRGGILAGFLGLVLSSLIFGWNAYVVVTCDIPWIWSVAPIPVVLLLATWLRSRDWMLERASWRARLQAAAIVGLPAIALLVAVPFYRAYEIPWVDPGFDVVAFQQKTTTEEQKTADLYLRANRLLTPKPMPEDVDDEPDESAELGTETPAAVSARESLEPLTESQIAWVAENQEPIALVLEASRRPRCRFSEDMYRQSQSRFVFSSELPTLMTYSARVLQDEGRLEEAFKRYLATLRMSERIKRDGSYWDHLFVRGRESLAYNAMRDWTAAEKQTPQLLRTAIERLEKMDATPPTFESANKIDYLRTRRILEGDSDLLPEHLAATYAFTSRVAPWEITRAVRFNRYLCRWRLEQSPHWRDKFDGKSPSKDARTLSEEWKVSQWYANTLFVENLTYPLDMAKEISIPIQSVNNHRQETLGILKQRLRELDSADASPPQSPATTSAGSATRQSAK